MFKAPTTETRRLDEDLLAPSVPASPMRLGGTSSTPPPTPPNQLHVLFAEMERLEPVTTATSSSTTVTVASSSVTTIQSSATTIAPLVAALPNVERDHIQYALPVMLEVTLAKKNLKLGRAARLVWVTRRQPTRHTIYYVYALRMYFIVDRVVGLDTSAIVGTHWDASVAAEHKIRSATIAAEMMLAVSTVLVRMGVEPQFAAREARNFVSHCVQTTSMTANYAFNDDSVRKFIGLPLAGERAELNQADQELAHRKLTELRRIMAITSPTREVSVQDYSSAAVLSVTVPRARDSHGRPLDREARKELPPWVLDDSVIGDSREFSFDAETVRTVSKSKKYQGKPMNRDGWICDIIEAGGSFPIVRTSSKQFATVTGDSDHMPITGDIPQQLRRGTNGATAPSPSTARSFSEMMGLLDAAAVLSSAPIEPEFKVLFQRLSGIPLKGILAAANVTVTNFAGAEISTTSAPTSQGLVAALSASTTHTSTATADNAMAVDVANTSTTTATTTVKSALKPKKSKASTTPTPSSSSTSTKRKTPSSVSKKMKKSSLVNDDESEEEADSSDDDDDDDDDREAVAALDDDDSDDDAGGGSRRKKSANKKRHLALRNLKTSTAPKMLSIGAPSYQLSYHYNELPDNCIGPTASSKNGALMAIAAFEHQKKKANDDDSSSSSTGAALSGLLLPSSSTATGSPKLFGNEMSKMALIGSLPPTIAVPMGGGPTVVANVVIPDIHKNTLVELLTMPKRFGSDLTTFIKRQPKLLEFVKGKFTDKSLSVIVFTEQFVPGNTWNAMVHDRDEKTYLLWEDGVQYGLEQLLTLRSVPGKPIYMHLDESVCVNATAPHVKMTGQDFGDGVVEWGAQALKDFEVGETLGIYVARVVPGCHAELDGSASVRLLCMDVPDEHLAADNYAADLVTVPGQDNKCCISGDDEQCRLISTLGKANHSDDPNAELLDLYDHDAHGVEVRAIKPIKAGDFVALNYGPEYMRSLRASGTPIVKLGGVVPVPPRIADELVATTLGVGLTTTTSSTKTSAVASASVAEAFNLLLANEEEPSL